MRSALVNLPVSTLQLKNTFTEDSNFQLKEDYYF